MGLIKIITLAAALVFSGAAAFADTVPRRVVSMNLCTDQLAMLIADPAQITSLSYLSTDPRSSAMHRRARDFPQNPSSEGQEAQKPCLFRQKEQLN